MLKWFKEIKMNNEELLQKIRENKQSIINVTDIVAKVSAGLYDLTRIVNEIVQEK